MINIKGVAMIYGVLTGISIAVTGTVIAAGKLANYISDLKDRHLEEQIQKEQDLRNGIVADVDYVEVS